MRKINWGTGIVVAFGTFMTFILFFVFLVQSDQKYDNELVIENYYKYETGLQRQLDKEGLAEKLDRKVAICSDSKGVKITFPPEFDYRHITGKVSLYRPSDQKLDFEIPISLSSPDLLIPMNQLTGGRWDITIEWNFKDVGYLNKQKLIIDTE